MEIKKETRFYLEDENGRYGEVVIDETNGVYDIVHTYVNDAYRGQGIAQKLVEQALTYIENQNGKVATSCSYAKHYLDKKFNLESK